MVQGDGPTARQDEVDSTDSVIQSIAGIGTKPFFRSPYGAYNASVNSDLAGFGYNFNIWWTVDSLGWNGLSISQILDRCLSLRSSAARCSAACITSTSGPHNVLHPHGHFGFADLVRQAPD